MSPTPTRNWNKTMTIKIKTLTAAIIAATSLSACNLVIDAAGNADQTTDTNTNEPVAFSQWQLQLNNNVVCSDDLTLCADVQLQARDQLVLKLANQADIQLPTIAKISSVLAQPSASAPTFTT